MSALRLEKSFVCGDRFPFQQPPQTMLSRGCFGKWALCIGFLHTVHQQAFSSNTSPPEILHPACPHGELVVAVFGGGFGFAAACFGGAAATEDAGGAFVIAPIGGFASVDVAAGGADCCAGPNGGCAAGGFVDGGADCSAGGFTAGRFASGRQPPQRHWPSGL